MDPLVRRSKRLSLILRHRPDSVGVSLDEAGWVDVTTLLEALSSHGTQLTREDLVEVVERNDKQRFEWDLETDRIRARQGHTIPADLDLPVREPPPRLFHGTPTRNVASILARGLDRGKRHHVHLSPDVETAHRVGARRGKHEVLVVDAARMHADGHAFRVTDNGVWLVDAVPPEYLALFPGNP